MVTSEEGKPVSIEASDSLSMTDSASTKVIISIIVTLAKSAGEAFKSGHYLESSIIMFQAVDYFLRLVINTWARQKGSSKDILARLRAEQHFPNLVIFLGLVKPDNGISERLFKFNKKRNAFVHRLFEFETIESLEKELIVFHEESLALIEALTSLIPTTWAEMFKQ
jgi:hypothetical protein